MNMTITQPFDAQVRNMVENQLRRRGIRDARVLEAMRLVPRHEFVQAELVDAAYDDRPLPIGERETISQPYIVAAMTQAAGVAPGARRSKSVGVAATRPRFSPKWALRFAPLKSIPDLRRRRANASAAGLREGKSFHRRRQRGPLRPRALRCRHRECGHAQRLAGPAQPTGGGRSPGGAGRKSASAGTLVAFETGWANHYPAPRPMPVCAPDRKRRLAERTNVAPGFAGCGKARRCCASVIPAGDEFNSRGQRPRNAR